MRSGGDLGLVASPRLPDARLLPRILVSLSIRELNARRDAVINADGKDGHRETAPGASVDLVTVTVLHKASAIGVGQHNLLKTPAEIWAYP